MVSSASGYSLPAKGVKKEENLQVHFSFQCVGGKEWNCPAAAAHSLPNPQVHVMVQLTMWTEVEAIPASPEPKGSGAEWFKSSPVPLPQRAGQAETVHSFLLDLSLFLDLPDFTGSLWSTANEGRSCCLRFRSSQITSIFHPARDVLLNNRCRYWRLIKALFSKPQAGTYPGFQRLDII